MQCGVYICEQCWTNDRVTHIGGLLIVINMVDVPRQAEVSDFHHVVLRYQNITSSQVSVDALQK